MANNESEEESAALEPVGQTTADLYAQELAAEQIHEAVELRTAFFSPRAPVTVAKGIYAVDGEIRTAISVNNFYTREVYEANRLAVEELRQFALRNGWEFEGGIFQQGATQETALHAEDNMLQIIQRLGLEPNARAAVGVSRNLCPRCLGLGEETTIEGAKGIIVQLANNIRVIIMAKP